MKRKATQSNPSSTASQSVLYEEAAGKTVDFIRYAEQVERLASVRCPIHRRYLLVHRAYASSSVSGSSSEDKQRNSQDHPGVWSNFIDR